ncbi:MAG TPA: FAD-dependent oxidoreductase [Stenomitos sp.]
MNVVIVGCGVVGAAIAYRLSQIPDWNVQVYDQRSPQHWEATGAALGVLMAAVSSRLKGKHVKLRLESLTLYESLIPELIQKTGIEIPFNCGGIIHLCFDESEFAHWETVQAKRLSQGFTLQRWTRAHLVENYPELEDAHIVGGCEAIGAIYSPQDRQVDPVALTQALIQGAKQQGAQIQFEQQVSGFRLGQDSPATISHVEIAGERIPADWVILASGLGTTPLTQSLSQPITLQPVLGQALHLRTSASLPPKCPVINGADVHLVPLAQHELWVGATVEFPDANPTIPLEPSPDAFAALMEQAIALWPDLEGAECLRSWQGLRPRPCDRAAPVIERLSGYSNVLVASGHYRNGILLAPVTAQRVQALLQTPL